MSSLFQLKPCPVDKNPPFLTCCRVITREIVSLVKKGVEESTLEQLGLKELSNDTDSTGGTDEMNS